MPARTKKIESTTITLPYRWRARPYQFPIYDAIVNKGILRAVGVWHRRGGKDLTFVNITATKMAQRKGIYYYFFPTYGQGKKILWDGMTKDGTKFLDYIPEQITTKKNDTEMKIEIVNGSILQVVGTDNFDSIISSVTMRLPSKSVVSSTVRT